MATKHDLENILRRHVGKANGLTANALAGLLQALPRMVRHLVSELRLDGVPVCGHPTTGYYIAANAEELDETCKFLRDRALHSLKLEATLRKTSLEALIGQLDFETDLKEVEDATA